MKIECVLKRDKGTKAEVGGILYHFEPLEDGAHVADITDEAHIDRFLSIADGYKVYHGKLAPTGEPVAVAVVQVQSTPEAKKPSGLLNGSSQHQPQYEIGGETYVLIDIIRKAFDASGLTEDDWNELDEDEVAAKLDIVLDDLAEAAEKEPVAADEHAALVEAYKVKFGKAPHYKASIDTLKAKLAE